MKRIKIENVGPIKDGYTGGNGYIDIDGLTVFIGNQGTGKSTIAKIISTLSWIEKALVRGDFTPGYITQYNRFKKQIAYQNIDNYLTSDSLIEYDGEAYSFKYMNGSLSIEERNRDNYSFPKIMYVPAERNFVSSVDRPDLIKRLPSSLYTFLDEYEEAKKQLSESILLPVGNLQFEYRKQSNKSWIIGKDYKINLLEASSGFQSLIPLYLVTRYLSRSITENSDSSVRVISVVEEKKIRKEIDRIFKNDNISEDVRRVLLEKLSSRFSYACLFNVVEEPEQNLYPTSQKEIIFELIKFNNEIEENQLILTTHSPYVINYLTLAIKANAVKLKGKSTRNIPQEFFGKLDSIVPLNSTLDPQKVNIYQLNSDGSIEILPNYHGLPSDENYLNEFLAEFNDSFIELIKLEESCQ